MPLQKVPKNRPGDGRRRTTATKGVAQVLSVLSPSPPFLQESRIKTAPQPIRRWSKPIHFATNCRCRSSGSCRTLLGLRDTPDCSIRLTRRSIVGRWGYCPCRREWQWRRGWGVSQLPQRRSIEGRTEGPVSAFLWRSDIVSFGKTKEMGSGKSHPKGVAFGLCLLFARAKRKSPQGETLPRKAGDGFLYRFFWQDKRNGVGKIASQRRQPLDTSSRTQSLKRPRVKSLAIAFHTNAA